MKEKVPATKNHVPKHQNQRERLQEQRRPHKWGYVTLLKQRPSFLTAFLS